MFVIVKLWESWAPCGWEPKSLVSPSLNILSDQLVVCAGAETITIAPTSKVVIVTRVISRPLQGSCAPGLSRAGRRNNIVAVKPGQVVFPWPKRPAQAYEDRKTAIRPTGRD